MLTPRYVELIEQLHSRTERGEVNWKPTSDKGEFLIFFDDFSLSVRSGHDENTQEGYVVFVLRNQAGSELDRFWIDESEKEWGKAYDLYMGARRKALRIEDAVEVLLRELKTKGAVGDDR